MTSPILSSPRSRLTSWARPALAASLVCGALYDLLFAALMLLAPQLPARLFALPLPAEPFYLWLLATLLGILAAVYLLAASDLRRYSGLVPIAALGRGLGAFAFGVAAWRWPHLSGLWGAAATDLAFAVWHGAAWWPIAR
jgi:hypothetical protein